MGNDTRISDEIYILVINILEKIVDKSQNIEGVWIKNIHL